MSAPGTLMRLTLHIWRQPSAKAAGRSTRGAWTHSAAGVLARRLGQPLVEFQGDGAAYATRPAAFAAQLAELLHDVTTPDGIG